MGNRARVGLKGSEPSVSKRSKGGRDDKGRFRKGHKNPGPGNPHVRRLAVYQEAIKRAVSVADLEAIFKALIKKAKAGNIEAAKVILDRTLGKAGPAQVDAQAIDLPSMTSAEECVEGFGRIFEAMREGKVNTSEAGQLANIIELTRRSIETVDIERRLRILEALQKGGKL